MYRLTYELFGRQWQEVATLPAIRALAAYLRKTFRIESEIERL
jgi:hypothetical protein